ncbi:MAG: hypothetical protein IPK70_07155 [Flavobacteriales bacterium]|jgi:hypothetical protein|nr:hypothetical protein [Flavobacteriales bacterium]
MMKPIAAIVGLLMLTIQGRGQVNIAPTIGENPAFDTLATRYDRNEISVDTTWAMSDSVWAALLLIGDADSIQTDQGWFQMGGVCAFSSLMTLDPHSGRIMDYREIHSACDVDQSNRDEIYEDHRVLTSSTVEVISSKAHYPDGSDEWDELIPFATHWYKVLNNGNIAAVGGGLITEPTLWKAR